jgi:hypothetical protein
VIFKGKMPYKQPPKEHQFKKGQGGRPKGMSNYKTIFLIAAKEIARLKKLGKEPDDFLKALLMQASKKALKGNYHFYKDILDRLYGQAKQTVEQEGELTVKIVRYSDNQKNQDQKINGDKTSS